MSQTTKEPRGPILAAPLETEAIATLRGPASRPVGVIARLNDNLQYIRGRGALEIGIIFVVLLVVFATISLISPETFPFLSQQNLSAVISQSVPIFGILGIGAGILMVAGEFDLSLGANIGFSAIIFIRVSEAIGWGWGIPAALLTGLGIALLNGVIVVVTRIPSFIATLGMNFFWLGAAIFVNGTIAPTLTVGHGTDSTLVAIFTGNHGFFRSQLVWLIVIGLAAWAFLHRHRRGNHIFAVGGNAAAAKAISINPIFVKLMSFSIFGALTGFVAILIAVQTTSVQPGTTNDFTLMAVAAAVVGGCSLNGGRGSVIGMVIGAALIQVVQNGLILGQAPGFYIQLFVGLIIVVAAIFNKLMEGKAS
jgi:simple sugar transport system permease protein